MSTHFHKPYEGCYSDCPEPHMTEEEARERDAEYAQLAEFLRAENERPDWDDYFLEIATTVSRRAACTRSRVGAVLVKDNRIVSTGYNGAPAGEVHCTDGGCPRGRLSYDELPPNSEYDNCIALHAEINCLAYSRDEARGGVMYVTRAPCDWCAKVLDAFGVERVVHP